MFEHALSLINWGGDTDFIRNKMIFEHLWKSCEYLDALGYGSNMKKWNVTCYMNVVDWLVADKQSQF